MAVRMRSLLMSLMRSRCRSAFGTLVGVALLAVALLAAGARTAVAQAVTQTVGPAVGQASRADSLHASYRRAQRLVNDGQGAEGRALIDSLLNAAEPRSPDEADALFWRATLAERSECRAPP